MNAVDALRRAYRWFWALTGVAIALTGALSAELAAASRPLVGLAVAVTATLLALVVAQACRIMLVISRVTPAKQRRDILRRR